MIGLETARQFLDFGGRIGATAAEEQLRGAVALHNMLEEHRVAYLADEVGMGKTYVALGAFALFRHFDPSFRLLILAPRENIQKKWAKERASFVKNNVLFPDLRVKAVHGAPARASVLCDSLIDLVRETALDPDRDFLARLTSFSLPLGTDTAGWIAKRDQLLDHLPWIDPELLSLRRKEEFKDSFARAICCAIPPFDLVIVDEAHNLKHGYRQAGSSRNRVLAHVFGHPLGRGADGFSGYGLRAKRVLLLSATPIEDDYRQLWNQLDVFGHGSAAAVLKEAKVGEAEKREAARGFVVRRVTSMRVAGRDLTKNLYRREWRNGGVADHDEPLAVPDVKQRLAVALVQKKVSEVLGSQRFNNSFQIGMLASFESFLETAKVAVGQDEAEGASNFDDAEQSEDALERQGIDVHAINRIARDYRKRFGAELPHPKMDALVAVLTSAVATGRKALVFVRRVASVKELQRKLEERYDQILFARLRSELKPALQPRLERIIARYREERVDRRDSAAAREDAVADERNAEVVDEGGNETFFAWFFRGEGPQGVLSGATVQRRFAQAGSTLSTFFEDNHIAALLGVGAAAVWETLVARHDGDPDALADELRNRAGPLLRNVKKQARRDVYLAFQESAILLLAEGSDPIAERAKVVVQERYQKGKASKAGAVSAPDPREWVNLSTFWTELRNHQVLRDRIWPKSEVTDFRARFREEEQRRELASAMVRLGNPMIDLYVLTVNRLESLELRRREQDGEAAQDMISAFLDLLDRQATEGSEQLTTLGELAEAADNFRLIVDVNVPELRDLPLVEVSRRLGQLLRRQQPIGGMFGAVNETLVRQFRMPGYPIVLVSTDLLQEGEDLHTFCSSVYHYGISWMPSSMEQRVGRVDRVSSQTERRLGAIDREPGGDELLQVYYPHLQETVEVLQVRRVLDRMQRFIRLMHLELGVPEAERRTLDVKEEILRMQRALQPHEQPLESAFPVREEYLSGSVRKLAVTPDATSGLLDRFCSLSRRTFPDLRIEWESRTPDNALTGTVHLDDRHQPFMLLLSSTGGWLVVRCISPVGRVYDNFDGDLIQRAAKDNLVRIAALYDTGFDSYDLTVEVDTTLAHPSHDQARVGALIARTVNAADRIEHALLGMDQPFATFREDLELELDPRYER